MKKILHLILIAFLILQICCAHSGGTQIATPLSLQPRQDAGNILSDAPLARESFDVILPTLAQATNLPPLPVNDAGTGPNGELIAAMNVGNRAPFSGTLFNGPALAYIEVEYRAVQERCMIDMRRETQEVAARYRAQLERLQASMDSFNAQHAIMIQGRDRQIQQLNRLVEQQRKASENNSWQTALWFGGGLLIGSFIVGSTAYIITK